MSTTMTMSTSSAAPLDASSSPVALLCALEDLGCDLAVVAGRLRVWPASRLTETLRAAIREHRAALIVLVQSCDPGVVSRRQVFARQWTLERTTSFQVCPGLPYERGQCFSCGDPTGDAGFGRCWRCNLAWRLAVGIPIVAEHDATRVPADINPLPEPPRVTAPLVGDQRGRAPPRPAPSACGGGPGVGVGLTRACLFYTLFV